MKGFMLSTVEFDRVNALFYGCLGSGKTYAALSFPGVLLITFDNGYLTGCRPFHEGTMRDAAIVKLENWLEVVAFVKDPEGAIAELKKSGDIQKDFKVQTIVFDTLTHMEPLLIKQILANDGRDQMTLPMWGLRTEKLRGFFIRVKEMQFHTIFICQEAFIRNDKTGDVIKQPAVGGEGKSGAILHSIPDIVLHFVPEVTDESVDYVAWSVPRDEWPARDRTGYLESRVVNPSFAPLRSAQQKLKEKKANG